MFRPRYDTLTESEPILRDWLAVDRTALANERTLLAYIRTSLALAILGGSLLKFFDSLSAELAGAFFLIVGAATAVLGCARFVAMQRRLTTIGRRESPSTGAFGGSDASTRAGPGNVS